MESPQFETLAQRLFPTLQNLELKRKELKKQGHFCGILQGSIFFAFGIAFSIYIDAGFIGLTIVIAIALNIYFVCVNGKSKILSSYYKKEVIAQVLQSFCKGATFTPEQGIAENVFRKSGLFTTTPDRYHTEDLIQGSVEKTYFYCAEVHAEKRKTQENSKGKTSHYWIDIFKGFLFIADFHKNFQGQTTILRNSLFKFNINGSRVKLENATFEKAFDVYATDQVEARYLLTPSMMERLLILDKESGKGITISFRDSSILVAIPESKNSFEANIWKQINNLNQLKEDFSTIHKLISIIEELNLNTRIWSKE